MHEESQSSAVITMPESDSETGFTYQLSARFGIHYPASMEKEIFRVLSKNSRYKKLATGGIVCLGKTNSVQSSRNCDDPEVKSPRGFIFIDAMTVSGKDCDAPEESYLHLDIKKLIKLEKTNNTACLFIKSMFEFIKESIDSKKIKYGWEIVSCSWDLDSDDESESSDSD